MRRLIRILLNVVTAVSLVLCLTMVALWVRSYWVADFAQATTGHVESSRGTLAAGGFHNRSKWRPEDLKSSDPGLRHSAPRNLSPRRALPGEPGVRSSSFAVGSLSWFITDGGTARIPTPWLPRRYNTGATPMTFYPVWQATVPHWAVAALLGLLPALRLLRRRSPTLPGHCLVCGYDLRATPGRCPECGHTPAHPHPDTTAETVSALTPGPASTPPHFGARP